MFSRDTVSVYRRRPKCLASDKENQHELDAPEITAQVPTAAKSPRTRKGRASWIDRSLSSRSSVNSFSPSRQTIKEAKTAFASPNVYRKKRVEAPANFVREQKSYFEQVDAFKLEEESPPSKDHWMPEPQQKDAIAPCMQLHTKGILQAVQEDACEEISNDNFKCTQSFRKDPLSHILDTPQSIQRLQKSESRGSLQYSKQELVANASVVTRVCHDAHVTEESASEVWFKRQSLLEVPTEILLDGMGQKAVHRSSSLMMEQPARCKAVVAPKEPHFVVISSDDDTENFGAVNSPESFSQSKHLSRQAQERGPARARQTVSQIIALDDFTVPLSRDSNTHSNVAPVKCEYSDCSSTSNKVPANRNHQEGVKEVASELLAESKTRVHNVHSHHQAEEGLVEQIKRLDFQASKDENYLDLSTLNEHNASREQHLILKIHAPNQAEKLSIFEALLKKCGQTAALPLEEAIMQFSDMRDVVKLGEGTYGEAFRTSNLVFKIVPMDGSFPVNGERQKTLAEMHMEMLLTITLNRFRKEMSSNFTMQQNVCNNFIETKTVKVCQGLYGQALIEAWEEWCTKHGSENDHPKVFPEKQLYMLFVLADGGRDLESFSVDSFDVARSILIQVTAALAIAEEDCEFEHRDLHWGNILVAQTKSNELYCKLDGTDMLIRTCGVLVHIIDFTLARLFTGKEVLYSDLSNDPLLFRGPKGDIQAEVYRKMLHLTEGHWDRRFLKTNCYWIHYLVDILLTRKKFACLHHETRGLRAFKKRVLSYDSARACLRDQFFASVMKERRLSQEQLIQSVSVCL